MKVAYISDPVFALHDTGEWHPESAMRMLALQRAVKPMEKSLIHLSPVKVSAKLIETVHTLEHIENVRAHCEALEPIDADTVCVKESWDAALAAVGAGIVAVDAVTDALAKRVFCGIRPPGHHATRSKAMGFCLFNNIAVTARYAQTRGYQKVAIIDFDVHHGNGTQDIFYDDGSVLYLSTHQSPAYPGSGNSDERGSGEGVGTTFNFPFAPGSGDDLVVPLYEERLGPILDDFSPDILLVSAGYDLHEADPLAGLAVTTEGVGRIVDAILKASDAPAIFMLEGGYNIDALQECVEITLKKMTETL